MTKSTGGSRKTPQASAGDVAEMVGGRCEGDPSVPVTGIAPLNQAQETDLGFLAQRRYLRHLPDSRARALLVAESLASEVEAFRARIVVDDPHQALPRLLSFFYPTPSVTPEIHPTAVLGPHVRLGDGVTLGPYAVLGEAVVLGDGVRVGAHSVIGEGCTVGPGSVLHPHVVLYPGTRIGERVILHSGVCLGVDGFGYVPAGDAIEKVPQVGACVIEDDVEIGANSCVDRGSIGRTVVGPHTKLDNLVHLAHNVQVGRGVLMAAMTGVAGSVDIGDGVMTGGQAGISGHLSLGAGSRIAAQGGVIGDVAPGATVSGYPARDHREYLRAMGAAFKLPDTLKRIKELEARLDALEESGEG